MKATIILLSGVLFLILIVILLFIKGRVMPTAPSIPFPSSSPQSSSSGSSFNPSSPTPTPPPLPTQIPVDTTGATITLSGVTMNNFINTSPQVDSEGDRSLANTQGYSIVYLAPFNKFLISITSSPFGTYRQQAEQALLSLLNISQTDACKLSVKIATSSTINPDQAGTSYPLSFCGQ